MLSRLFAFLFMYYPNKQLFPFFEVRNAPLEEPLLRPVRLSVALVSSQQARCFCFPEVRVLGNETWVLILCSGVTMLCESVDRGIGPY
jgi:hypothetical protein